jgi:hypothetical protein
MPAPKRASPLKGKAPIDPDEVIPPKRGRTQTETEPAPPKPATTAKASGTNNPIGNPVMVDMPTSTHEVLNNLVCRELIDPSGPMEPLSQTVLSFQATVDAMSRGTDITPYKEHIQRIATNQPEKGDVIRAYVNQIEHEMIADLTVMRANAMRVIKRASGRNDVTVSEGLVIWRMCNEQLPDLKRGINLDKAVDSVTVVEKIDYAKQQAERVTHTQWEGTTPQGRELIRKKLWEVEQEVLAKLASPAQS